MYYANLERFKTHAGYEIDGAWYPRVTKIVDIKAKPALYKFYGEMASFAEGEAVKTQSASEGTLIHETIEKIMLGDAPVIHPSIRAAVDAYIQFAEKKNIQTDKEFIERRIVHHGERYAGTIDALASIDGKFGVLDIKTSQAIYRDYNLQTSAYVAALEAEFDNLETRWILRIDQARCCLSCGATLREKGGRRKIKLPWKNDNESSVARECEHEWSEMKGDVELKEFPHWKEDFIAFLGAKKLWEWENEYWLRQIGYATPRTLP